MGSGRSASPTASWIRSIPVLDIASWACLVAFLLITVASTFVDGRLFLSTDLLSLAAPWGTSTSVPLGIVSRYVGDTIDTVAPQTIAIAESVRSGALQQWDPYSAGGVELGGLPNSGAWSPLSVPWFVFPIAIAPAAVKILEIITITVGMCLLLRRYRLPSFTWPLASLVFAASGFMLSWTNWPQTRVAAFIPLLFWAIDRASTSSRVRDALPVLLVLAAMLAGGFPAVVAYALYAGGIYAIIRSAIHHRTALGVVKAVLINALGLVGSVFLCGALLVPFVLNATSVLDLSVREQSPNETLGWEDFASLVVPSLTGTADGRILTNGSPIEGMSYIGVTALALALVSLVIRRPRRHLGMPLVFALVTAGVCAILLFAGGPALAVAQELPVFSDNFIGRLRVLLGFFLAVAAAFGLARVVGEARGDIDAPPSRRQTVLRTIGGGLVGLAVIAVVAVSVRVTMQLFSDDLVDAAGSDVLDQGRLDLLGEVRSDVLVAVIIAATTAVLVLVAVLVRRGPVRRGVAVVLLVLVAAPATMTASSWWPRSAPATAYPETSTHEFLQESIGGSRLATVDAAMLPGTSSVYGLRTVGSHAFQTTEWKDLLLRVDPESLVSPTFSTLSSSTIADTIASPILDRLAVRYTVTNPQVMPIGEPEVLSAGTRSADFQEPGRSAIGTGPVRGVLLTLGAGVVEPDGLDITLTLTNPDTGVEIVTSTSRITSSSGVLWLGVAGDAIPADGRWVLSTTVDDLDAPATVAVDDEGLLALSVVRPVEGDGLRVVHSGDATVYERTTAADRVRWADNAIVVPDRSDRIATMDDPELPTTTTILENADDVQPVETGSSATITDTSTGTDVQSFEVEASGDGWLVVADSLRRSGWTATVDGRPVDLVPAEHAAAAVYVEGGSHTIELTYDTPGRDLGLGVSLISAGVLVLAVLVGMLVARRRPVRERSARAVPLDAGSTPTD